MLKKIIDARGKAKLLLALFNYSRKLKGGSGNIRVPIINGIGRANLKTSDPHVKNALSLLLENSDGAFIDVGVNIGQTLIKLVSLGFKNHYLGFEPNPSAVNYVEKLIEINKIRNTEVIPVGLSNKTAVVNLYLSDSVDSGASAINGFRDASFYSLRRYISVFCGDDVLEATGAPNVSILKIDVEGGEYEVLSGFKGTIGKCRPVIVCEILPAVKGFSANANAERINRAKLIENFTRENKYMMFKILLGGGYRTICDITEELDTQGTDYVFIPEERNDVLAVLSDGVR